MCSVNSEIMDFFARGNLTDESVTWTMLSELYAQGVGLPGFMYQPWFCSLIGSILIGLSGIFPLLVIPIDEGANLKTGGGARTLNVLLSFAVGCLLGDVFLHLLPEVWSEAKTDGPGMNKGLWVLAGLLIFIILEKMFTFHQSTDSKPESEPAAETESHNNNSPATMSKSNGHVKKEPIQNGHHAPTEIANGKLDAIAPKAMIHVSGYLNLMANSFDNFTHGLAVGGSFMISFPHGVLTTAAILLHEIPHEVGDFAILLRSGFSRWEAARAQILTATAGMFGSLTAVLLSGASGAIETRTSWILPFTAGGFLHIALVTVLPDLLKEENPVESMLQLASLLTGIGVMAGMASMAE